MKKIINTFKHGSSRTKGILIMTFLAGLTAAGFAVCAVVFGQLMLFFGAVIASFVAVSLAQTFGIYGIDEPDNVGLVQENRIENNYDLAPKHEVRKREKKRKGKSAPEEKYLKNESVLEEKKVLKKEKTLKKEKSSKKKNLWLKKKFLKRKKLRKIRSLRRKRIMIQRMI